LPDTAICSRFGSTRVGRAVPGRLFMTGVLPLTYTGATGAVLLVAVLVSPVTAEVPLPPPRPREQGPVPSPPPAPAQPTPAKPPPTASPPDEECLTNLQKLGFDAEAVSAPPAPEAECVINKPVRLRSLRLGTGPVQDIAFPVVACRFAERFGRWVGDLAAVLVRGQLGTDLKAVRTGVGFECRKRNRAASGKLSAHALGLAVDVAGFELASGDSLFVTESQDSPKVARVSVGAEVSGTHLRIIEQFRALSLVSDLAGF
jgi:hypothetical protein